MEVVVVDYGLGNLWSVRNAFEKIGARVAISSNPSEIVSSKFLILPGVGSFKAGMENLRSSNLVEVLSQAVLEKKVPILGICLGMQLLAEGSEEAPDTEGLGFIPGQVRKVFANSLRLPHMGFNQVYPLKNIQNNIFQGSAKNESPDFYFVHSYCFVPSNEEHILATTKYGQMFVSAVCKENIIGMQFHPEKSQSNGLRILSNVLKFASNNLHG